ncbi:MAG: ATP synthase F1 subunit epsilon [Phycisphaerae bacterium]|nr:ATP synthase F1 subunit epsilon [Phycisphaerae bacterium]
MAASRTFSLEVMTPNGPVTSADVSVVILPAADGELGILAGHAPVVTLLGAGVLAFTDAAGKRVRYWAAGGFAHVRDNAVSVLPEVCCPLEKLDPAAAQQELDAARALPAATREAAARRTAAVNTAQAKLRAAVAAR